MTVPAHDDPEMTFEVAYDRLEEVLTRLQLGNMTLDESILAYEEGMALAAHCQALLDAAQLRIEQLDRGFDGAEDDDDPPF